MGHNGLNRKKFLEMLYTKSIDANTDSYHSDAKLKLFRVCPNNMSFLGITTSML